MIEDRFIGRVAVVTGAASGIGARIAQLLLAEGALVVASDRDEGALAAFVAEHSRVVGVCGDVTDEGYVQALFEVADEHGGVDVVVNCAGIGGGQRLVDQSLDEWSRILDVCLAGVFLVTKHAGRQMIRRQRPGSIVNISSISAQVPSYGAGAYSVAKAGVEMLTQVAALELSDHKIRVNAVAPGLVETPMARSTGNLTASIRGAWLRQTPLGRIGATDDIARAVLFLAGGDSSWVTGAVVPVDGGARISALRSLGKEQD